MKEEFKLTSSFHFFSFQKYDKIFNQLDFISLIYPLKKIREKALEK